MSKNIVLKLATIDDFDLFYAIKKEESNMYWSGHVKEPVYEDLKIFYISVIEHRYTLDRDIYIIYRNEFEKCGYIYLDRIDNITGLISIGVAEKYSNIGIGTKAIEQICNIATIKYGLHVLTSEIREDNVASQHTFENNKFQRTAKYRNVYIENIKKHIKMFEYERKVK